MDLHAEFTKLTQIFWVKLNPFSKIAGKRYVMIFMEKVLIMRLVYSLE